MKITEQQLQTLHSLHCERLSCKEDNLRLIELFFNSKGEGLVEIAVLTLVLHLDNHLASILVLTMMSTRLYLSLESVWLPSLSKNL